MSTDIDQGRRRLGIESPRLGRAMLANVEAGSDDGTRTSILRRAALHFIAIYQLKVGPRLGARCRFQPSCSEYGRLAFLKHGFVVATAKTTVRVARCTFGKRSSVPDLP
jgi:uncharacterized protein